MVGVRVARLVGLAAGLALCVAAAGAVEAADCRDDRVDLRGPWGSAAFTVEVVDTDETRAQGLMHRPSMPRFAGMLFVFDPPPGRAVFWMENTLIPLDMLFLDETGIVTRIHHEARPLDRTPLHGGDAVLYVLEINGGMARRLGIVEGSALRHPRIDPALAAWPCAAPPGG